MLCYTMLFWIVSLFLTDKKVSQTNKDIWNVNVQLASQLWAEHNFNCGRTGLRKAEKMSRKLPVLVARARRQPMKTLKHWRKYCLTWGLNQDLTSHSLASTLPTKCVRSINFKQFCCQSSMNILINASQIGCISNTNQGVLLPDTNQITRTIGLENTL